MSKEFTGIWIKTMDFRAKSQNPIPGRQNYLNFMSTLMEAGKKRKVGGNFQMSDLLDWMKKMPWRKMANVRVEIGFMANESMNANSHLAKLHMYLLFDLAATLLRLHLQGELKTKCWKQPHIVGRGKELAVQLRMIEYQTDGKEEQSFLYITMDLSLEYSVKCKKHNMVCYHLSKKGGRGVKYLGSLVIAYIKKTKWQTTDTLSGYW